LAPDSLSIKEHTAHIERELIAKALDETKGNRTRAARLLEISHRTLLYKLKEYDIS
jgi:two-component system response regulator AtoC